MGEITDISEKQKSSIGGQAKWICEEYIKHYSLSQASKDTGVSWKKAKDVVMSEEGREYIGELEQRRADQNLGESFLLVERLTQIVNINMKDFVDFDSENLQIKALKDMPDYAGYVIAAVSCTTLANGSGRVDFKLHNKMPAIDLLAKIYKLTDEGVNVKKLIENASKYSDAELDKRIEEAQRRVNKAS